MEYMCYEDAADASAATLMRGRLSYSADEGYSFVLGGYTVYVNADTHAEYRTEYIGCDGEREVSANIYVDRICSLMLNADGCQYDVSADDVPSKAVERAVAEIEREEYRMIERW